MKKLRAAVIGLGFIGACHVEAIRRLGFAEVVAAADANEDFGRAKAQELCIDRYYTDIAQMLASEEIDIVHNCTPNHIHWEVNKQVIEAGKHILSEKPLGLDSRETEALLALLARHPQVVHAVNFNYRMNPLVQDMRHKVKNGDIGRPLLVHGSYLQDWLLYPTDYNWRLEQSFSGQSRAVADIGSHWMDTVQTVLDDQITEVCADLVTVFPQRQKPLTTAETFGQSSSAATPYTVDTEDYGAVLFRTRKGVSGVFHVSQVSAGHKCGLSLEVDGTESALYWNQENADRMWMGFRDQHNREIVRNSQLMDPAARPYTQLAAGHPEGWNDAMKNNVYSFYQFIREGRKHGEKADFATFCDGHSLVRLTEAILQSSKSRSWITIDS